MGTDARASFVEGGFGEGGDEPPVRFRGDELDLYGEFHFELVKMLSKNVRATRETVEDACGHAWVEFFKYQPDRERGRWRGWLFRVAQREAWRLTALDWKERAGGRFGADLTLRRVSRRV